MRVWQAVYDYGWLEAVIVSWSVAYCMCLVRFRIHDVKHCAMASLIDPSKRIGRNEVVTISEDLSSNTNAAQLEHIIPAPCHEGCKKRQLDGNTRKIFKC